MHIGIEINTIKSFLKQKDFEVLSQIYKNDAIVIDRLIRETWGLNEQPIIYFREGDNTASSVQEVLQDQFDHKQHPAGYRSWHYLIKTSPTKQQDIAEIQVRTIFEEGWSEIDHQLRYPYDLDNHLLND